MQPNARVPVPHYHESWDETVYGLLGVMTWRVDGHDIMVGPGQTLFIKRGVVHGFRNDAQPAKCLCILSPGMLGPTYFREMASLLANGIFLQLKSLNWTWTGENARSLLAFSALSPLCGKIAQKQDYVAEGD